MSFPAVPMDPVAVFSAFAAQIGGRHLVFNLTDAQKRIFSHQLSQMLILFGIFYFSTRSFAIAALLWAIYHLSIWILLNESHPWNIMPRNWLVREGLLARPEKTTQELYYENVGRMTGMD